MWTEIMHAFPCCFDPKKDAKLVEALRCLYFGRVASYLAEVAYLSPDESEERVLAQTKSFFEKRDYFLGKV